MKIVRHGTPRGGRCHEPDTSAAHLPMHDAPHAARSLALVVLFAYAVGGAAPATNDCSVDLVNAVTWQPPTAMSRCQFITISGTPLGEGVGSKLSPVLSRADKLESLDLSHMALGDAGVRVLAAALKGARHVV